MIVAGANLQFPEGERAKVFTNLTLAQSFVSIMNLIALDSFLKQPKTLSVYLLLIKINQKELDYHLVNFFFCRVNATVKVYIWFASIELSQDIDSS